MMTMSAHEEDGMRYQACPMGCDGGCSFCDYTGGMTYAEWEVHLRVTGLVWPGEEDDDDGDA